MKKTLLSLSAAALLGLASVSAYASPINVGGVIWDPESITALPSLIDFSGNGTLLETATTGVIGSEVTGRGLITQINNSLPNGASFCPGCELTYTFSMDLASIDVVSGTYSTFLFNNLKVNIFVDHTPDYSGSVASASDGVLWLSLVGNGNLTGTGNDIGTGSDTGSGGSLLDVTGGLAAAYFDTNTRLNGADFVFSSSFQPLPGEFETVDGVQRQLLFGTIDLKGNSVPEPGSLALLGLGLAGLSMANRRRKQVK